MRWFYRTPTKEFGPYAPAEFRALVAQGAVTPATEIRREDMTAWVPASSVKGLLPAAPSAQPAPTTADTPKEQAKVFFRRKRTLAGLGIAAVIAFGLLLYYTVWAPSSASGPDQAKTSAPMGTEELVAVSEPSVAFIQGRFAAGTGFLISPKILATNAHVLGFEFYNDLQATFPSAEEGKQGPYDLKLLYYDEKRDLAFLRVNAPIPPLKIAPRYTFRRGQEVIAIGNPGLDDAVVLKSAISRGVLSSEIQLEEQNFFQLGIAVNPGNSGGPAINNQGLVVGMVTRKAFFQEGVALCIPAAEIEQAAAKIPSLSDSAIRACQAEQKLNVTYRGMMALCQRYEFETYRFSDLVDSAVKEGLTLETALRKESEGHPVLVDVQGSMVFDKVQIAMSWISSDPNLPDNVRTQFVEFWKSLNALRTHLDFPQGTPEEFRQRMNELKDTSRRCGMSLGKFLKVRME